MDQEGVLAFCFGTFAKYGLNVMEISFDSFAKREACTTNITFKGEPNEDTSLVFRELLSNEHIFAVKL